MTTMYDNDFVNAFELTEDDLGEVSGAQVALATSLTPFLGACSTCGFGLTGLGIAPFVTAFSNAVGFYVGLNLNFAAAPSISTNFLTALA